MSCVIGFRISSPMWAMAPSVRPNEGKGLGHLPGQAEVQGYGADGAGHVDGQGTARRYSGKLGDS